MDREKAIEEVDWYRQLVVRKLRAWGHDLNPEIRRLLIANIDEVAAHHESLQYKQEKDGYYIGQTDEDGLRHGYGIFTRTTDRHDRWAMQAGYWQEGRPMGTHTLYDSDCPQAHHYLAAMHFLGERRRERGMVEVSISEKGINTRPRKYRRWEGFSLSTLAVGSAMIFFFILALTRNVRITLIVVAFVAGLYFLGSLRGRD